MDTSVRGPVTKATSFARTRQARFRLLYRYDCRASITGTGYSANVASRTCELVGSSV